MAESWADRVAHQRLRDQDLRRKGHSHIDDQKVMFINRNPYNETKLPRQQSAQLQTDRRATDGPRPNPINGLLRNILCHGRRESKRKSQAWLRPLSNIRMRWRID